MHTQILRFLLPVSFLRYDNIPPSKKIAEKFAYVQFLLYLCTRFVYMNIEDLEILFSQHPEIGLIRRELGRGKDTHVLVSGLHASARALALGALNAPLFIILDNSEAAQYLYADLKNIKNASGNQNTEVFFFPHSQKRRAVDEAAQIQRTETLTALTTTGNLIVVTYPEAIAETVPAKEELSAVSVQYRVGQEIQQSTLSSQLLELGFERVDFVFQPGQYAVRGSIVDIYSYSHDTPFRLDFFGDEIDSIREFDIEDQLSKNRVNLCEIVGKGQKDDAPDTKASIVDYLPSETIWVSNDVSVVRYKLEGLGSLERLERLGNLDTHRTLELSEKRHSKAHRRRLQDLHPRRATETTRPPESHLRICQSGGGLFHRHQCSPP